VSHKPNGEALVCKTSSCGFKSRVRLQAGGLADGRRQRIANAPSEQALWVRLPPLPPPDYVESAAQWWATSFETWGVGFSRGFESSALLCGPRRLTRKTSALQAGNPGATPGRSTTLALWRSSKRSGLISRPSKVQLLPASPSPAKCYKGHAPFVAEGCRGRSGGRLHQIVACSNG
jgi:hypothetical protein